jgi:uncharacterized secreted protein with C-terminal beta-propeller domain
MKNSKNLRSAQGASAALRGFHWAAAAAVALAFGAVACGDDSGSSSASTADDSTTDDSTADDSAPGDLTAIGEDLPEGEYESAHPSGVVEGGDNAARGATDTTAGTGSAAGGDYDESADDGADYAADPGSVTADGEQSAEEPEPGAEPPTAERAIEEADIIKVSGDRLYALSQYGGLSVVDVSDPDDLKLLGRHRSTATPFEMYVRDDTVFVLYNGYGEYEYDEGEDYWTFYQTSYVISLDTENPKNIKEDEKFEIAGYISDSRLIGDALYVVAYDDSYCYRCGNVAETNVMSLDVSVPDDIEKVDELTFPERQDEYGWRRSLSATDERLYIAGPRYGSGSEPEGSIIQVVDVSEADGSMQEGDSLKVAGQINSRWQMDEYDGVLRVVSQPMWWRGDGVPTVETFQIESSDELVPLAELPMDLPRPEELQAVRFDGERGYAITFERTDPLFTLDLSDPENPVQAGQLEMPGWVYYMEPRGDRVIGLGFDQGNADGALTVSIFDVSDLSEPTMVDRVNFGGDWASLAEDQDRIHKSFQVLDAHDLILVPFSGWVWNEAQAENECRESETFLSGVQLIDWGDDELTLRGIADSQGQARRAFFVGERLLTMSDERVEAFDIGDRGEPESTSKVDLAQIVDQLAVAGDSIVRIGNSWWGDSLEATVSSLEDLENFEPGVTVELPGINTYDCDSESWLDSIMSSGDRAYFLYNYYNWREEKDEQMKVLTLDVSDPSDPQIAGDASIGFRPSYGRTYVPGMVDNGVPAVAVGDGLVFAEHDTEYNNLGFIVKSGYTLEVVDFSDPAEPERSTIEMPESIGSTGLVTSGNIVATSHFEISPTNSSAVRFYLDRVDVSDAGDPEQMDPVNIPGSLLAYDHDNARALTVDYQYVRIEDISPQQCYEEEFGQFLTDDPSRVDYEDGRGPCQALRYKLHLVEIEDGVALTVGSYDADKGVQITGAAIGKDRVFLGTGTSGGYGYAGYDEPYYGDDVAIARGGFGIGYYSYGFQTGEAKLLVASGLASGDLEVASLTVETASDFYGFSGMVAKGKTAVVSTGWQGRLSVIDASDASNPVVRDSDELGGYVRDLDLAGNVAIAALGEFGVQTIELGD